MNELFLLYYLQSQRSEFVRAGTGGAQPNISQGIVKGWPIPVPTLEVQSLILSSIAEEKTQIDSAKKLIETYENRIRTLVSKLWST
jgi:type I restriction enzyme S subunit